MQAGRGRQHCRSSQGCGVQLARRTAPEHRHRFFKFYSKLPRSGPAAPQRWAGLCMSAEGRRWRWPLLFAPSLYSVSSIARTVWPTTVLHTAGGPAQPLLELCRWVAELPDHQLEAHSQTITRIAVAAAAPRA